MIVLKALLFMGAAMEDPNLCLLRFSNVNVAFNIASESAEHDTKTRFMLTPETTPGNGFEMGHNLLRNLRSYADVGLYQNPGNMGRGSVVVIMLLSLI
ncbi:hypothetical protein G7Y89_g717 [Cudoniella acicularis]|uniref:Uncharacterized protein n=1 Tax=Cudoniella acicularis TaxID=354080 RepID=A0A8H4RWM0_9HELO|nr:hypothetical protein G7Y89_g717 [Cudoniella acicularis]